MQYAAEIAVWGAEVASRQEDESATEAKEVRQALLGFVARLQGASDLPAAWKQTDTPDLLNLRQVLKSSRRERAQILRILLG